MLHFANSIVQISKHKIIVQGIPVTVFTLTSDISDCASLWAQGGIIYKGKLDSPEKLGSDVHAAGAGICNHDAVNQLGVNGPPAVEELLLDLCQTEFEKAAGGNLKLTLEAAHSVPRIIYTGDYTGQIMVVIQAPTSVRLGEFLDARNEDWNMAASAKFPRLRDLERGFVMTCEVVYVR